MRLVGSRGWSIHQERTFNEELVPHCDTPKIAQDFQNQTAAHRECEAVCSVEKPLDDLHEKENSEDTHECCVGEGVGDVSNNCIVKRAQRWCALREVCDI